MVGMDSEVPATVIPLIDINPLVEKIDDPKLASDNDVLEVVRKLDDACKDPGFFYVKGHGISESLLREVRDAAHTFFKLPNEEKTKIQLTPESGYRGYQRVGMTHNVHEAINSYAPFAPGKYGDLGKMMAGYNQWPEYPAAFKTLLENYINLLRYLSRKILRGIALASGGPVDAIEQTITQDPFWALRLVCYPPKPDVPEEKRADMGMGAHTDYGLLTMVNQDEDTCALEVQTRSGEWIHAKPIPGSFVCNIGDLLKIWSNGIYQATVHRVANNSPNARVSVIFFSESNFDATVGPVDFCQEKTGGTAKYDKVVYANHLNAKIMSHYHHK